MCGVAGGLDDVEEDSELSTQLPSQQATQKNKERMEVQLATSAQRHIVKQVAMPESPSGPAGYSAAASHSTSCTPFSGGSISVLILLLIFRRRTSL